MTRPAFYVSLCKFLFYLILVETKTRIANACAVSETNLSGRASDHAILSAIRVFSTRKPECQVCATLRILGNSLKSRFFQELYFSKDLKSLQLFKNVTHTNNYCSCRS